MKRILLFLATNLAIVLMLSLTMRLLGVEPYLNAQGLNLNALLLFAALMGFGGAFISLALSKWTAKMSVGAEVIEDPRTREERWLVQTVARQAEAAGIRRPEVAIYDSPEVNAFATGMSR
jgi:heat shock protein HtpX